MSEEAPAVVPVGLPEDHPASQAWRLATAGPGSPVAVHVLKENWKTLAYRLVGCGPDGGDVVATRRPTDTTLLERRIYTDVLSRTAVPNVRLLGSLDEPDGSSWMFLDDAGDDAPDLRSFEGRVLVGTWLGRLHDELRAEAAPPGLPDRGPADALRGLRASRSDLLSTAAGGHVEDEDRRFIGELVRRLDAIEAAWGAVADTSGGLPSTLVHADLVGKNLRIKHGVDGTPSIVAFDWEMSGWGVPLRDLALVDIGAYASAARSVWGERSGDLGRLAEIGRVCSLLASIEWEMPGLRTDWPSRYLARLRVSHERLGTAAARAGIGVPARTPGRGHRGPRIDPWSPGDMGDPARLERGLRSMEPHGRVRIVDVIDCRPNVYRSTYPSAIVRCAFDDGAERSVFVKRHVPGLHAGGSFWDGGSYETDVYRDLLSAARSGTPDYYGSWSDPDEGGTYLAVEYVEGWRLSRSEAPWLVEAARWLGHLHRDLSGVALRHPAIRRYDRPFFEGRSREALQALRSWGAGAGWRESLFRVFDEEMIPLLVEAQPTFVHGEPYPQNILVSDGRIRVVDWQSAAIGPGAIDLACLTLGHWPPELVAESEAAYVAERWGATASPPAAFGAELAAARLYWAMRWLSTDVDATTAGQREFDLEALRASANVLGLAPAIG